MFRLTKLDLLNFVIVALGRVVPHPPNLNPLMAVTTTTSKDNLSLLKCMLLPVAMFFVSDLLLSLLYLAPKTFFTDWMVSGSGLYAGSYKLYMIVALIGAMNYAILRKPTIVKVYGSLSLSTLAFFVLTNLSVWMGQDGVYYSKDLAGLLTCYTMALPFLGWALLGDLCYITAILATQKGFWPRMNLFQSYSLQRA
jgi:hypothetical protein